ncbi:MAG: hypothetical protein ACI8RD_002363 [Bacillariaceae sp.]
MYIYITTPLYAPSITFRLKAGLTLINSRKKKSPPPATANTQSTVASAVAAAEAAEATSPPPKRKLDHVLGTPPLQSGLKKRAKTSTVTADTASKTTKVTPSFLFKANPSNSLDSEEEPTAETVIDIPDSSSSDSEATSEETFFPIFPGVRSDGTGFMDERSI